VSGLAVRLLIIAAIVVGGIVFRDRLSGGAQDLRAGDCFDDKPGTEIKDVQHHPCDEAHTAEVILVKDNAAAKGSAYPGDAGFEAWAGANCVPAILAYLAPTTNLNTLNYGIMYPKAEDWKDGDRQMICYVTRIDQAPMTQSLRVGGS
jgi:hypothetical protein